MKAAIVRQRAATPPAANWLMCLCPHCEGRHWLPAGTSATAHVRTSARPFAIAAATKRKPAPQINRGASDDPAG